MSRSLYLFHTRPAPRAHALTMVCDTLGIIPCAFDALLLIKNETTLHQIQQITEPIDDYVWTSPSAIDFFWETPKLAERITANARHLCVGPASERALRSYGQSNIIAPTTEPYDMAHLFALPKLHLNQRHLAFMTHQNPNKKHLDAA